MPGWLSSLRDLIAEASPLRRIMLALLVILPLAALGAAYVWFNPPVYRVLYTQLSDRAGGEVITALEQLDISYRLSASDGTIMVPADQLHAARYRLAARGLPRSDENAQDEVDRAPRFGASSLQEQQRFQRALEIDLARSIQKLEAVELARVHLALPKVSPFLRDAPLATAAVVVRLRPGAQLNADQVMTIQTLVAAGVPRLKRTEVQVLDPRGILLGAAVPEAVPSPRLALEQDLARRALAVLTPWLGKDRVSVHVNATLEDSDTQQTEARVRNVVVAGQARPLEKTTRTAAASEARIQNINSIVILGFEASTDEQSRAAQMAGQALGLQPARGDTLKVFALPAVAAKPQAGAAPVPRTATPSAVSPTRAVGSSPAGVAFVLPQWLLPAVAAVLLLLATWIGLRLRREPVAAVEVEPDFDVELDAVRGRVLADPRVTADVIKLWMRA